MAETYKHLDSALHQPPVPAQSYAAPMPSMAYGADFPDQPPRPENDKPGVYQYEQEDQTPRPGAQSLHDYPVPVLPEDYHEHYAVHPEHLYSYTPTHNAKNELTDSEIVTHHTGQQVRYKYQPETGMYVYRGLVYPTHEKDVPLKTLEDEKAPIGNDMKYVRRADRSDYYDAPTPETQVPAVQYSKPAHYSIHSARFYKPLPKQFDGGYSDYAQAAAPTLGNATYNQTNYVY